MIYNFVWFEKKELYFENELKYRKKLQKTTFSKTESGLILFLNQLLTSKKIILWGQDCIHPFQFNGLKM
jgi:hypothetical protein